MFTLLKATLVDNNRVLRISCSQVVTETVIRRLKNDPVISDVTKAIRRIDNSTLEVQVFLTEIGTVLDDLWSAGIEVFDQWLLVELTNAMATRQPRQIRQFKNSSNPFTRLTSDKYGPKYF